MMALITGNTSNTLNLFAWQTLNWAAGNQYQIHKVLIVLDQPGRGRGDLISGNPPTPVGWPHQEQEPCYSWNNIHSPGGQHLNFVLGSGAGNSHCYADSDTNCDTYSAYSHQLRWPNVPGQRRSTMVCRHRFCRRFDFFDYSFNYRNIGPNVVSNGTLCANAHVQHSSR